MLPGQAIPPAGLHKSQVLRSPRLWLCACLLRCAVLQDSFSSHWLSPWTHGGDTGVPEMRPVKLAPAHLSIMRRTSV